MPGEGTCNHCGQDILWVKTEKGSNMPLDPDPIPADKPIAKFMLSDEEPDVAVWVPIKERAGTLYATHFDTCQDPAQVQRRAENEAAWRAKQAAKNK